MKTTAVRLLMLLMLAGLYSCEKEEQPVTLPPKSENSYYDQADVGENYENMVYYSLENHSFVKSVALASWDLAFQSGAEDHYVFLNGGNGMLLQHTGKYDFSKVNSSNIEANAVKIANDKDWACDDPGGSGDSSAVGEWLNVSGTTTGEIYAVAVGEVFYKFRINSVSSFNYIIEFAALDDTQTKTVEIAKNNSCSYSYFSFANESHVVFPEPEKSTWDVVFTRYYHIYRDLDDFRYIVVGPLLNPYRTSAAKDSTSGFENITEERISGYQYSSRKDAIGFDWKSFDYSDPNSSRYVTNKNKCYIVKTQSGEVWKMHFLDYYSLGYKGSPSFEYERLQ